MARERVEFFLQIVVAGKRNARGEGDRGTGGQGDRLDRLGRLGRLEGSE